MKPARTYDTYEQKAKDTAEAVLSAVETARLIARTADRGDAFAPYVSVVLAESEDDAVHAREVFASVQPPNRRADRLRAELTDLVDSAIDALAALRITARRAQDKALVDLATPLENLGRRLERFSEDHS